MLGMNYNNCFRACKVSVLRASNKRHVIVPFNTAAYASIGRGFYPIMVNPELPIPKPVPTKDFIPTVVLVGHKDHGKTSLMERLIGSPLRIHEPGSSTQAVMAVTITTSVDGTDLKATFIDTPGEDIFDVVRGRAIHLANVAIVVISSCGGEMQTKEALLQADKFNIPVLFCFTKADLEFTDIQVCKSELKCACNALLKEKMLSRSYDQEIQDAISTSAINNENIDLLVKRIHALTVGSGCMANPLHVQADFGGEPLSMYEHFIRRTNSLVTTGKPPSAICFILEVEKTHSHGIVLTVLVRHGNLVEGNWFLAGTEYGRIEAIYPTNKPIIPENKLSHVSVGYAVKIRGLKNLNGTSVDDLLLVVPQLDAYRLSCYRKNIQTLQSHQTSGPPLNVYWAMNVKQPEQFYRNVDKQDTIDSAPPSTDPEPFTIDSAPPSTDPEPRSIYLKPIEEEDTYGAEMEERNEQLRRRWKIKSPKIHPLPSKPKDTRYESLTPETGKLVIPVILRTNHVGMLDTLLDAIEHLEKEFDLRIPLVHGGIGPISPNDIVQAEIANKFTPCPVYAFQVPILQDAAKHAVINKVVIKQFNVYFDLINEVRERCKRITRRRNEALYHKQLNG
ncbi:bifunctional P-loop containing nucleoside triphosphate hydrolase/Small GTP-binding protein domain/Translation initiation factor IF- 2/Translation initiation factor IF- 2 [Babesia duncani]|uniref:Bifunctional P-loop containing nucleoside triphosphate hydrolase/Small GTP-binding protein domain/Translation initiation factor IF- 2/Translation initiation factor IF- 2 n=1 Tax=Babesia duncani TaxID=323732 RepID=A0AAD9UQH9_9APIC|nr:bifunctional P-loop containing nucleoside triphosphate hydrolase/Small GTP-binding protein domain/Translation initiation factor IF- 2/Translation initiation factor IF- 2 [Babesia duncani]